VPVDGAVVEMAECDAQHLGRVAENVGAERAERTHVGAEQDERTHVGAEQDERTHVGAEQDERKHVGTERVRATQSVPPRTRRLVLRRDHRQCVVPGCRGATFVDVHHLDLRSEGGGHQPERLVTLCGAHHRACHRGQILIEGWAPGGLSFQHADGSSYGQAEVDPDFIDVFETAFGALRTLGFAEKAARRSLAVVRCGLAPRTPNLDTPAGRRPLSVETLLRGALAVLT